MKSIFSSLLLLAALSFFSGNTAFAQSATDSLKTATIKVKGIGCGNDMATIQKQLINQEGVDEVTFTDLHNNASTFTVSYHTAATTEDKLSKAIEATAGCESPNEFPYKAKLQNTKTSHK